MEEVTYNFDNTATQVIAEEVKEIQYDNLFSPARLDGEVYETYKKRQLAASKQLRQNAKGRMLWNSAEKGTYIKAKHGVL